MANNVGSFWRDRSLMMSHCHSHCDLWDTVLHYFFREKKEHTMTAELILSPSSMILLNKFPRNTRNLNLNPYDSGIKKKVWYSTSGGNKCNIDQPKVNEFIINEFVHELKEEDYDLWKNSREKWRKCISPWTSASATYRQTGWGLHQRRWSNDACATPQWRPRHELAWIWTDFLSEQRRATDCRQEGGR